MTAVPRRFGLIAAAGTSVRFGGALPKQYAPIAGVPMLAHTIAALNRSIVLETIFVVLPPGDKYYAERIGSIAGVVPVYEGGATRGESVRNGLAAIGKRAAAGQVTAYLNHHAGTEAMLASSSTRKKPVSGKMSLNFRSVASAMQ